LTHHCGSGHLAAPIKAVVARWLDIKAATTHYDSHQHPVFLILFSHLPACVLTKHGHANTSFKNHVRGYHTWDGHTITFHRDDDDPEELLPFMFD
jgi:hypothetical protein